MGNRKLNYLSKVIVLAGLLLLCSVIRAQTAFLHQDSLTRSPKIFHANIGYGVGTSTLGSSAWTGVDNKSNMGITYAFRWLRCFNQNSMGYGLYLWNYRDHNKHSLPENYWLNEKVNMVYFAPQFSFIRKETAFPNVFGLINMGVGYLNYISNSDFDKAQNYRIRCNTVGMNADIGLEYAFHENWGIKLEVGGLFSPIRPKMDSLNENLPIQPRNRVNLFIAYLQLGISTYL